jgi:fucose permease
MSDTLNTRRTQALLVAVAFGSMLLFGFVENIKGAVIPSIRDTFQVSYVSVGVMLFIGSAGYLTATFLGGLAGDRYGQKRVIGAGYGLIFLAGLGMAFASTFPQVCVLMFALNMGFGSLEVGVNSLGARIFLRNSALMMNLTHFFYGVGSMGGPAYAAAMLVHGTPWGRVYALAVFATIVVVLILLLARFPGAAERQSEQRLTIRQVAANGKVWLFVLVISLLVIVEVGIGNWLVSYLRGTYAMSEDQSAQWLSLFFLFFTLGRLFGGYIVEKLGYVRCIATFIVLILGLYAGGFALGQSGVILFSVIGFFISIMYPTFMALIMKEFPVATGSVMGFVISAVAAVSMVMNWVVGQTSDLLGVAAGFGSFMLYAALALLGLFFLNRHLTFNKKAAPVTYSVPVN